MDTDVSTGHRRGKAREWLARYFNALVIMASELPGHVAGRRHVQARGSARVHSGRATAWPGPTARPNDPTEVIDLAGVPTTSLVLNRR
jgi:hypothetical protein